jgi:hypothetical protein
VAQNLLEPVKSRSSGSDTNTVSGSGSRRSRDTDRGAALVEAALVFPLLLTMIFGIIETGLLLKNQNTVVTASAAGARTAVAQPRQGDYEVNATAAAQAVLRGATGTPVRVIVYRAHGATGRPCTSSYGGACTADIGPTAAMDTCTQCWIFDWAGTGWSKRSLPTWPAASQAACGSVALTDYLGVYVEFRHDDLTGFFGSARSIKESTMMRLEPVPTSPTSPCR